MDAHRLIERAPYPPATIAVMQTAFDEAWGIILLRQDVTPDNMSVARKRLATIITLQSSRHWTARRSQLFMWGEMGAASPQLTIKASFHNYAMRGRKSEPADRFRFEDDPRAPAFRR
jgi:hypothetical protein